MLIIPAMAGLSSPFPSAFRSDVAALRPRRRLNDAGLGSSPFARRYLGNHVCFLLLRVLRCFSSPGLPPHLRVIGSLQLGCPIRKSPDHGLFAPPRSLSQLITSFLASESQGIPRTLLVTFSILLTRLFLRIPRTLRAGGHFRPSVPLGTGRLFDCQAYFLP